MTSSLLSVPLKKTWEVDLIKPLTSFINEVYSTDVNKDEYINALVELNRLRNNALTKTIDKSENGLETIYKYYDQLNAIEAKMPISESQIRISFKWQDAFDKEALFATKKTMSLTSGLFEKVGVLFNIAALQSQTAEQQNMNHDENLKLAAKLFQLSSGIFGHLKSVSPSAVHAEGCCDLNPDVLNALAAIMLAQAQDCFVKKAVDDKMKPGVVAKISSQCADFYSDASKLMQLDSIKGYWPKDWMNIVASKHAGYNAISQFYQSLVAKDNKEFGEEIARLRLSKDSMLACEMRSGICFSFGDFKSKIQKSLTDAEKDNDFIYHARIPEPSALAPIGKAQLAKPTNVQAVMSKSFKDLFSNLMPLAVQNATSIYEQRKSALLNLEVGRMREATQFLNSVLASLNLPAALEDSEGVNVPPSLVAKSAAIRELGGYERLNQIINELPLLLQRNKEILDESEKLLNEEQSSDEQLKSQFGDKWNRTPSVQLTESIRSEASKYRTIITNAINADSIVRQRFNQHKADIQLLSKSPNEIGGELPSFQGGKEGNGKEGSAVRELRSIIAKLDEIKSKRDDLENTFKQKSAADNMTSQFVAALSGDGLINEESISSEHLDKVFKPLREEVQSSISAQEDLLKKLEAANTSFAEGRQQNASSMKREERMKMLASAHDSFMELKSNLEEGTKFYNDLTEILVKFQSKVSDFCFARRTEKEELMKDLSAGIARQSYNPPPLPPTYQKPAEDSDKEKPARPPPPSKGLTKPSDSATPVPAARTNNTPAQQSGYPIGYQPYPPQPGQYPPQHYNTMPMPQYAPPMPTGYNPYFQPYPQQPQNYLPNFYPNQQPPAYPPYNAFPPQQFGTYPR